MLQVEYYDAEFSSRSVVQVVRVITDSHAFLRNRMFERTPAIVFTLFQIVWAIVWAAGHLRVRRRRGYALNRTPGGKNLRYRAVSYFLFGMQNILCVASFWSHPRGILSIHDSGWLRIAGVAVISLATLLYFISLRYLGKNYSPCFDAHLPAELVTTGPYKFIRHPMYLAKLAVIAGDFILSGSVWFVFMFAYLLCETVTTIRSEEESLTNSIRGYPEYKQTTPTVVPLVF